MKATALLVVEVELALAPDASDAAVRAALEDVQPILEAWKQDVRHRFLSGGIQVGAARASLLGAPPDTVTGAFAALADLLREGAGE